MSWPLWLAFFAASWAISISPGPGAVAVMSASLNHGFARGYFATFGLVLGMWTQLVVVAAAPRVRRPTRPTLASKRRRLDGKRERAEVKSLRAPVKDS